MNRIRRAFAALATRRQRRASVQIEQCVECGANHVQYVWVHLETGDHESTCSHCHLPGSAVEGWVRIVMRYDTPWMRGEIESRIATYLDATQINGDRRERAATRRQFAMSRSPR